MKKILSVLLFSGFLALNADITPTVRIQLGDITRSSCQSIVNAANEELSGGAGVCGAIFKAAGWKELQTACNAYPAAHGVRCRVGQSCITESFALKVRGIRHIIHAVGPDCRVIKDPCQQDALLESAYKTALIVADQNAIESIAFPFISSAIYAFPKERACAIAVKTVLDYTKNNRTNIKDIQFVLFSQDDFDLFSSMIAQ